MGGGTAGGLMLMGGSVWLSAGRGVRGIKSILQSRGRRAGRDKTRSSLNTSPRPWYSEGTNVRPGGEGRGREG